MSTNATAPKAERRSAAAAGEVAAGRSLQKGQAENVVRAIGPWHGWNPLPGYGHKWMLAQHIQLSPTCYRIWAWLLDHTLALGCAEYTEQYNTRSPYAVMKHKDGTVVEAHLEHVAADLDVNIKNLYHYWQEGIAAGVWRYGTDKQGARRLYLCTEVKSGPQKLQEAPESGVCTYSWEKLPGYVSNHLQTLPAEDQERFWIEYKLSEKIGKLLVAEAVATGREVIGQEQDTLFRQFGAEKKTQVHEKKGIAPESIQARAERQAKLRGILQEYVHTLREFVRSESETVYEPGYKLQNGGASLLPSETLQRETERAGASVRNSAAQAAGAKPSPDGKRLKQQYAPIPAKAAASETTVAKNGHTPTASTEENAAIFSFLTEVHAMQGSFPHTRFGEQKVRLDNGGDLGWALNIVRAVGVKSVQDFVPFVRFQLGLLHVPAFGKLPRPKHTPATKPEERFLGLISEWAKDFSRQAPDLALLIGEHDAAEAARQSYQDRYEREKRDRIIKQAGETLTNPKSDEQDRQLAIELLTAYGAGGDVCQ